MSRTAQAQDQRSTSLGLDEYLFVLRRQWRFILAVTVLGALAAAGLLLFSPGTARATTTLNLNVITTDPFNPQRPASGLLDGPAEAGIARSHVVAVRAAEILDDRFTASEIRAASEVATAQSATVINVSFEGRSAEEAIDGANAVASAYLDFRREQADRRVQSILDSYGDQIDALNESLVEVNRVMVAESPTSAEGVQAATQQQQILAELSDLLSARNSLRSVDTTSGTVLTSAEDSRIVYEPSRRMTLLTGLGLGLVIGVVAAFVRNGTDHRVRSMREAARELGAPRIDDEPRITGAGTDFGARDDRRGSARSETLPGLRVARERILTRLGDDGTLLLFDVSDEAGPSPSAVRLAELIEESEEGVSVVIPARGDAAALLAALRDSDAAVAVIATRAARTDQLRWFRREAAVSGVPIIGVVEGRVLDAAIGLLPEECPADPRDASE